MNKVLSPRVTFVFPGQGSQRIGMLEPVAEVAGLERLLDAAEGLSGLDLRRLAAEGPEESLSDTLAAQPLLYLTDWAWAVTLADAGLAPVAVAGHSLGELAALAFAGVYSVEAGLELVCQRAQLMADAVKTTPGGMLAVLGVSRTELAEVLAGVDNVWVANDNSPTQVIISGTKDGLEHAVSIIEAATAARIRALEVSGPFHTPLLQPAQDVFGAILDVTAFSDARIPVLQNTLPEPTTDATMIRERLRAQMTSPVRWTETMNAFVALNIDTVIECGPGRVLAGLAKKTGSFSAVAPDVDGIERAMEVVLR